MKTKEELSAIKAEVEALNKKLCELTDEELKQVVGGKAMGPNVSDIIGSAVVPGTLITNMDVN